MKKYTVFAVAVLAVAFAFAANQQGKPVRVDITSQPEGVEVFVDGTLRGVTPLTLFDLSKGTHRAKFSKKGYESVDDFFQVTDAPHVLRHASLEPLLGLLLLTTEPTGCEISEDGISLGTSPRLITTLDVTRPHRLSITKTGYQPKTIEVRFSGRTPLAKHESLVQDSGTVSIVSVPAGAKITVDGIDRGIAPLTLSDVPKGRVAVDFSMEGYEPVKREISVTAGESVNLEVTLDPIPGSLFITSVPDGARIYVDGVACGKAPYSDDRIKPGEHTVRAEIDGYAPVERTVVVGLGQKTSEEFRLENVRGRIEIRTTPPGAQIVIDGRPAGTTKASRSTATTSDVLTIDNIDAGEHTLVVKRDGYAEVVKHPVVEVGRTSVTNVKMHRVFAPNVEIVTWTGSYKGVFVDRTTEALTIEVSMGVMRTFQLSEIRDIIWLMKGEEK